MSKLCQNNCVVYPPIQQADAKKKLIYKQIHQSNRVKSIKQCAGFTLMEVLLAMTLLSIMVVLLFGSLKIGAESWDKGETKIAEVNEKAAVYHFFKRYLPSIRPLRNDFTEDESAFSFQGTRDQLKFVSVFSASVGRKGLQLFEVNFDKEDKVIKVILTPFYPTQENQEWKQEEVILLENVKKITFSYFGKEAFDKKSSWVYNWEEKNSLPRLIRISINLEDQSFWPEMVFALKMSTQGIGDDLEDFDETLDFEF